MRIWWYLSSQFLKATLSALFFALLLYFVLTYMEESQYYFDGHKAPPSVVFFYYFWQVPTIFTMLLPFAIMVGGIVCNWTLARFGEISALRAAGLSMMRIAIPFLCIGFAFSVLQFVVNEVISPYTSSRFQHVKEVEIEGKKGDNLFTTSTWLKTQNSILHFESYNPETQTLTHPEFFYFEKSSHLASQIVHAQSGHFDKNKRLWVLESASVSNFSHLPKIITNKTTPDYETNIDFAPPQVLKQKSESGNLSYWQLKKLIRDAQVAGTNVSDRLVDLQLKVSMPFANFLFVFLTLPFALRKERQDENYIGIVICLVAALVYWFGNLSLRNLAVKGTVNPLVAAWFMNVLIIILSYMLVRKLDKGQ